MCDISKAWVDLGRGKGLKEGESKKARRKWDA